jgi:hypothetical protein
VNSPHLAFIYLNSPFVWGKTLGVNILLHEDDLS